MGCACSKSGEVAMVGFTNPKAQLLLRSTSNAVSNSSHIRITNLTVNEKPYIYLGPLEQKINIRHVGRVYKPNDYLQILQDLRVQFFQYLDSRTVLQDDRGRPVSARYRKAIDWKLYERFEREFASELYSLRHEHLTRQELYDLFESYIQKTNIKLRPERLQTDGHDDRREYIGKILIIPSVSTTNKVENYIINNNDDDSSSSSSSESRSSKTGQSTKYVKSRRRSSSSKSNASSDSDSSSDTESKSHKKKEGVVNNQTGPSGAATVAFKEETNSLSSSTSSKSDSRTENSTEQLIDYESLLENEFQQIVEDGVSADEYILLILLYSQALEDLRNQPQGQGQEQENVISNFKKSFLSKRKIMIDKLKETRRKREKDSRIPDTKGYTEAVEKELKENEENIDIGRLLKTDSTGTETETDNTQSEHEKQLQDYIDKQTALIKKLEAERENEIKQLEAEIAATQTSDNTSDTLDNGEEETDKTDDQSNKEDQKKIEKAKKKLKKAVIEDPSDKKNIKKKLKHIRKKLKETVEEVDKERLKRLETIEEEREEITDPDFDMIENTENYGKMVVKQLIKDEDVLMKEIQQLKELKKHDMLEFERKKNHLNDYLEQQRNTVLKIEENRKEAVDKTESDLIERKLKDMNVKCLENIMDNITDDERIKQMLEKHRKDQTDLAKEVDSNRLRQRTLLQKRLNELRDKQGRSADEENEASLLNIIRSTDDFSSDFDNELQNETDEFLAALKDIENTDSEKRRNMIKEHLDRIDDTFKRLDSDRNDIVTNILRSTNLEEELVDDLNTEFIKTIEEDIDSFDDETARRKIEEHRRRQIKLLEDMDADRLQKRSLLAQKLLQRQNKPAVDEQAQPQSVMKTDEYCKAIDKELQCNEDELMKFLTKDVAEINEENREKEISEKIEDYVGRQKQLVGRFETERKEKILEVAKGPTVDVPSNLNEINGWLKRSLSNKHSSSEEDVKDKLAEFRKKQRHLLEDVDSRRLQQKKMLQLKLKKLREEKESSNTASSEQNSDTENVVEDIAAITGTNREMSEEDKEFVKKIYKQKEQNTLSEEELQKLMLEHFSGKSKMRDLINEKNKSSRNQILERKESVKKKREEEEEKRRIQEKEEQSIQEEKEEEQRKALSRAYRNNEMVKSSSLIRKHQADQARMAIVVEEGKSKVKDKIREKKRRKHQHENEYGAEES